jgi:hypothetical protein
MDITKCETCGGNVEPRREGNVQGLYCKKCGWVAATSYIPPIMLDDTIYRVRVSGADFRNENHIRIVSDIAGLNFVEGRQLLRQEKPLVFEGHAPLVLQVRDRLVNAGLSPEISPPFDY